MINLLAIGLDYLMLKKDNVRGDVRERQLDYARHLGELHLVIYSPRSLGLKQEQWAQNLWVYPTSSKNKVTFIFDAYRKCKEILRTRKIDAISSEDPFTTGLVGYVLKKKFNLPLNIQVHNDFCDNKYWIGMRKTNWFFNRLGKFNLKKSDTIRVGTEYERLKLSKRAGISKDRIYVVPVNSEIKKFNADGAALRQEYLKKGFKNILLFSGRLVPQKGISTLLNAFKIVLQARPDSLLLIVGSGPEEKSLKEIASILKITNNTIFIGSIQHEKIPEFLAACDVYTITSLFEGTCIAMTEAMAAGKPIVATRFAGAIDLIRDGENGCIINQEDFKAAADRILYLLDNPEKAKTMGKNAREIITGSFTNNQNIDKVIELWEKTALVK